MTVSGYWYDQSFSEWGADYYRWQFNTTWVFHFVFEYYSVEFLKVQSNQTRAEVGIVGSVVECSPATRAARVRFPDDAIWFWYNIFGVRVPHIVVKSPWCSWGYRSVVDHSTADREVPGSNPGAPYHFLFFCDITCFRSMQRFTLLNYLIGQVIYTGFLGTNNATDHTAMKAPVLVWSLKLTMARLG